MIYLSRLLLNPRHRAVRRDLADCHALHRTILSAFPALPPGQASPRDQFGVLYRLDSSPHLPDRSAALVQSLVEPDWSRLDRLGPGYLLDTAGGPENPACKPIDHLHALIEPGLTLRFRLRANPTKKIPARTSDGANRPNGARVELTGDEHLFAWLERKGVRHGFALPASSLGDQPNIRVLVEDKVKGRRALAAGDLARGSDLTFSSVLFDGVLRVTDAEAFRRALIEGVGSAKAYGFGLLTLARA